MIKHNHIPTVYIQLFYLFCAQRVETLELIILILNKNEFVANNYLIILNET